MGIGDEAGLRPDTRVGKRDQSNPAGVQSCGAGQANSIAATEHGSGLPAHTA